MIFINLNTSMLNSRMSAEHSVSSVLPMTVERPFGFLLHGTKIKFIIIPLPSVRSNQTA